MVMVTVAEVEVEKYVKYGKWITSLEVAEAAAVAAAVYPTPCKIQEMGHLMVMEDAAVEEAVAEVYPTPCNIWEMSHLWFQRQRWQ